MRAAFNWKIAKVLEEMQWTIITLLVIIKERKGDTVQRHGN